MGYEKTHIRLKILAFGFLNILYYFSTNLFHVCLHVKKIFSIFLTVMPSFFSRPCFQCPGAPTMHTTSIWITKGPYLHILSRFTSGPESLTVKVTVPPTFYDIKNTFIYWLCPLSSKYFQHCVWVVVFVSMDNGIDREGLDPKNCIAAFACRNVRFQ